MGKNTKKLVVKDTGNHNGKNVQPAKWDDLITPNELASQLLLEVVRRLKDLVSKYQDFINSDKKLSGDVLSITKTIEVFKSDLKEIESLHTVETKDGKRVFRTGEISTTDEKAMILFLNTAMAYEAFIDKIRNYLDTTLVTFGGNLAEVVEKRKKGANNG